MTSVDVVVCAHDERRLPVLAQCLDAISAELEANDQLIVVIDHNEQLLNTLRERFRDAAGGDAVMAVMAATDHAAANLAPFVAGGGNSPAKIIIPNAGSRGLSAARNTGMSAGQGDIICFIDDDAIAQPGWRAALSDAFLDSTVTAIGGRIEPEFVDKHGQPHAAPQYLPAVHGWIYGCDYAEMAPNGSEIRNPIGAAMALRRSAAELVGEFSTHFGRTQANGAGAEETDYFLRLSAVIPEARIIRYTDFAVRHRVPFERTTWQHFARRAFQEGRSKSLLASTAHGTTGAEANHLKSAIPHQFRADLRRVFGRSGKAALRSMWLNATVVAATGVGFFSGRNGAVQQDTEDNAASAQERAPRPVVSVVMCTNGQSPYLFEALTSVAANHPSAVGAGEVPMEIIVVDNSLAGDLAERTDLGHFADIEPRFRIVRAPVPGLSRARNVGIEAARGEYIAFTDDDAIVDKQWVQALLSGFDTADVYCVTGRTTAFDLSKEVYRLFEELVSFDKGPHGRRWNLATADTPPLYPLPAGSLGAGNNMAFRAAAFSELGGFAEELGAGRPTRGGEDLDMFRRVILAGHDLVYRPEAAAQHRHRDTYESLRTQFYGYGLGMTASLTRAIFDDPATLRRIVHELPAALKYFLTIRSGSSEPYGLTDSAGPAAPSSAPRPTRIGIRARGTRLRLIGIEVLGLAAGPFVFTSTRLKDALGALGFTKRI